MDINPAWMKFDYYQSDGHPGDPTPVSLLPSQQPSPYSYYDPSTRDFTAVSHVDDYKSLAPGEHTGPQPVAVGAIAVPVTPDRWLRAAIKTTRPRQWPKNLLVFAAPLAAASLGRDHGFEYALLAMFSFAFASAAVYFINDVVDVERDRRHR